MRLKIKNWSNFQHYKDRCPPWIKLHYRILQSKDWVMSSDADRVLAIASMLIASQDQANDGSFDADPDYFQRVAYLNSKPCFKSLIKIGFLEVLADASKCEQSVQSAIPETEKETEKELETEKRKPQRASRLPQDWQPNDRMLAFCENERPDLNPTEVSATFRDYWHSQAGQKGVKADWEATWRNWVRNQRMAAKSPQRAAIGYRSQNELIAAELIAELKNG